MMATILDLSHATTIREASPQSDTGSLATGISPASERSLVSKTLIDASQAPVNGVVRVKLYKGNVIVAGRKSDDSLFDMNIATFEDDAGAYNQKDAEGFIKLNALRMRIAALKGRR